jgi:hypothetical protein
MATIAVALAWLAVLLKAPGAWRTSGPPARRALWVALLALALGWTLRTPWGYHGFDDLSATPNLAQYVGDGLALGTGCAILAMLLHQTNDLPTASQRIRSRSASLLIVLVTMGVAFVLAPVENETTEFVTQYRSEPGLLAYWLPFLAYLSYVFLDLTRLCRRYARLSERRYLTIGMRLIQVAGVLGIAYVALRAAYLVAVHVSDSEHLATYEPASKALVASLSILAIVGATLPAVGPRLEAYRAHRELYPLWSALYRATPDIALSPPASPARERLRWRDLQFRLHRRVIEIRDGQMALRPYMHPDVAEEARQRGRQERLAGEDLAAAVEAKLLVAGIEDKVSNRPSAPAKPAAPSVGGSQLSDEVSWLRHVARRFTIEQSQQEKRHARY